MVTAGLTVQGFTSFQVFAAYCTFQVRRLSLLSCCLRLHHGPPLSLNLPLFLKVFTRPYYRAQVGG